LPSFQEISALRFSTSEVARSQGILLFAALLLARVSTKVFPIENTNLGVYLAIRI